MRIAHEPPFRDPVPGAESYRRDLLRDRRSALVEMPPAIRAVFVARCGRIGGGLAGAGASVLLLSLAGVAREVGRMPDFATALIPGPAPAVLATMLLVAWIAAIAGNLIGRLTGERYFQRQMTRWLMPSSDAIDDVERLEQDTPAAVGRRLTQGIESLAASFGLLGVATLLAVSAPALLGWRQIDFVEDNLLAAAPALARSGVVALAVALFIYGGLRRWNAVAVSRGMGIATALVIASLLVFSYLGGLAPGLAAGAWALLLVRRERAALGLGVDVAALDQPAMRLLGRGLRRLGVALAPLGRAARATGRYMWAHPIATTLLLVQLGIGILFTWAGSKGHARAVRTVSAAAAARAPAPVPPVPEPVPTVAPACACPPAEAAH